MVLLSSNPENPLGPNWLESEFLGDCGADAGIPSSCIQHHQAPNWLWDAPSSRSGSIAQSLRWGDRSSNKWPNPHQESRVGQFL